MTTRVRWRNRVVKNSKVVSIGLELNREDSVPINPEKIETILQSKLNPFQRSQKKKEILKSKIKRNKKLSIIEDN